MKPTENDVLSGRGSWFNQHPGNERFRRIIEEQKAVYIQCTKKQKMNMSNAIVESIYSMEPPGRFLKKCPDTGRWSELSKREASDRVAQAMAYAVRGKEKLKQQREERRRSRTSSRQKSKDDAAALSSQSADRPAQLRLHASNNNEFEDSGSSSAARHDGMVARGGGAVGTNNKAHSANELLLPDTSNLQQQLLQQLLQSSSTTLPTSSVSPTIDQNGLARLLVQTLQQQQLQQQQQQQHLPLQHTLGQDSLGIQTQTPLQPALLERLTQLLNQTQQQQQRNEDQQELLLQRLLNQQTVVPSGTLPPTLSLSAPFLTGPRSYPANSNHLQNQVHLQSNPSNALLLSVLSTSLHQPNSGNDVGISSAPQGAQQMELQRNLMLQHQQLLASSLGASLNDRLPFQQQQSQPLDSLLQQAMQAALQLRQNNS